MPRNGGCIEGHYAMRGGRLFTFWTTTGSWIFRQCRSTHWNAECVGWHVCKRERPLSPPTDSRSPWGLPALYGNDRGRRGSGAGLADAITAPSICRTTSPTRMQVAGAFRSRPTTLSRNVSPRPTASPMRSRIGTLTATQIDPWSHLPHAIAELRDRAGPRLRSNSYNAQWIVDGELAT